MTWDEVPFRRGNIKEVIDGTGETGDVSDGTICGTDHLCSVSENWWFYVASGVIEIGENNPVLCSVSIQWHDGRGPLWALFDWGYFLRGGVCGEDGLVVDHVGDHN